MSGQRHFPEANEQAAHRTYPPLHDDSVSSDPPLPLHYHDDRTRVDRLQLVILGLLIGFILLFIVTLLYLVVPIITELIREKVPISKKKLKQRYATIEGWLISKRVQAHSETCKACRKCRVNKLPQIKLSPSHDTTETELEEHHECPICMEAFQVNDIVSWSPNTNCSHVFHHECIKEWLVFHEDCPYCRKKMLLTDGQANLEKTQLKGLAQKRHRRVRTTYFCVEDGLVELSSPKSISGKPVVLAELEELRGSRAPDVVSMESFEDNVPQIELVFRPSRDQGENDVEAPNISRNNTE